MLDYMSGPLWFYSHTDLWKHKNRVMKVRLWFKSKKNILQERVLDLNKIIYNKKGPGQFQGIHGISRINTKL